MAPEALYVPDAGRFRRHLALIKYCVEKELINQAVLLGREWLVS
ncbi:TM1812 family CRISPR-associated protein [Syntrophothermus sp.]